MLFQFGVVNSMKKNMLIDGAYLEETRVVICNEEEIDDFDHETKSKQQVRGNLYLAKVARVEPSLQAAFVDFGNNRNGFLPLTEIHPDYFKIPSADKEIVSELNDKINEKPEDHEIDDKNNESDKKGEQRKDGPFFSRWTRMVINK